KQARSFLILGGIEDDIAARTVVATARIFGVDLYRAIQEFVARSRVDCVQTLVICSGTVLRHRDGIYNPIAAHRAGDDRGGSNPDLGADLIAATVVGRRFARFESPYMPNRSAGVSIEDVHAVMFGGHDEQIVSACRGGDRRKIQRLRVDLAVHGDGEQLPEGSEVYVRGGENRLFHVPTARVVVVVGPYLLPGRHGSPQQRR